MGIEWLDVLRHSGLASVELERFSHRQEDGAASVHRLLVLGSDRLLLVNSGLRAAVRVAGGGQSVHRIHPAAQLVLQPVPLRHSDQTVQKGLRHDLQSHRGVAGYPRHRTLPTQFQFQ